MKRLIIFLISFSLAAGLLGWAGNLFKVEARCWTSCCNRPIQCNQGNCRGGDGQCQDAFGWCTESRGYLGNIGVGCQVFRTGSGLPTPTPTPNPFPAWFQTAVGDVHANGRLGTKDSRYLRDGLFAF